MVSRCKKYEVNLMKQMDVFRKSIECAHILMNRNGRFGASARDLLKHVRSFI